MLKANLYSITFTILFISASAYTLLIYTVGTESKAMTKHAAKGRQLYQEYNCQSCHQLYGLGGYMGPDLTNVISAKGKGEAYAKALISSGTARMPDFNLTEEEVTGLIEYLKYVDGTGRSPVYKPSLTVWGTVEEQTQNHQANLSDAK